MVYIIVFIMSIAAIYIGLDYREKNKYIFIICSFIGLLIPCIIAGIRDYSIGTDMQVYVIRLYQVAKHFNTFPEYLANTGSQVKDILYLFVTFISSKMSKDIFLLLFFNGLLTILPIYKALLILNTKKEGVIAGMLVFFFMYYNLSLNIVRQSIAISFVILSFAYFTKKKYIPSVFFYIIGLLFHRSSLVMIIAFALYLFYSKKDINIKVRKGIEIFLISMTLIATVFLPNIIRLLIDLKVLDYAHFSKILQMFTFFDFNIARTFFYILIFLIILLNKNILKNKLVNSEFYIFLSCWSIFILQLGAAIKYSERIGLYFFFIAIMFTIPRLFDEGIASKVELKELLKKIQTIDFKGINFKKLDYKNIMVRYNKIINTVLVNGYLLFYWVYWIVIKNSNETFPFLIR